MGIVEDYRDHYLAKDWDSLLTCLDPDDFERIGPYLDVFSDPKEYVAFLARIVPVMGKDYDLLVERIVYAPAEKTAYAQLVEHLEVDGVMTDIPEILVFGFNDEGLIRRIRLYITQPGGLAPVGGAAGMGKQP